MTRHEQMRRAARVFHVEHPYIFSLFVRFTLEKIDQGHKHYSASAVFQRIRWETDRPDYAKGLDFKLNNNHIPFYARGLMRKFPKHAGFFRTRHQISRESDASKLGPLGPRDYGVDHHV